MAVITVETAGKTSCLQLRIQTRLMSQYNGKWLISLVYLPKPLMIVLTAIRETSAQTIFLPFFALTSNKRLNSENFSIALGSTRKFRIKLT